MELHDHASWRITLFNLFLDKAQGYNEEPMLKKTFKVPDMHCSNCSMRLESIEDELAGIKEINASYHKQQMIVEFDETKITEDQIIAAAKKKGYQAVPA